MQYALCPSCLSTLQVTTEQLTLKDGLIRCAHCKAVFNAHDNPIDTPTEFIAAKDSTLISTSPTPVTATWEAPQKATTTLPYGLFSFILALALIGQALYNQSSTLTQNPSLQPFFKQINSTFNWHIPAYRNLDGIQIIERQLGPHATLNNALSLQLTIKNTAPIEQHYPTINVILTSNLGNKVAHAVFTKHDYLQPSETNDFFKQNALRQLKLTFSKPIKEASGFEISFSQ